MHLILFLGNTGIIILVFGARWSYIPLALLAGTTAGEGVHTVLVWADLAVPRTSVPCGFEIGDHRATFTAHTDRDADNARHGVTRAFICTRSVAFPDPTLYNNWVQTAGLHIGQLGSCHDLLVCPIVDLATIQDLSASYPAGGTLLVRIDLLSDVA